MTTHIHGLYGLGAFGLNEHRYSSSDSVTIKRLKLTANDFFVNRTELLVSWI